jgi:Flp pilus assembly pilin Flp
MALQVRWRETVGAVKTCPQQGQVGLTKAYFFAIEVMMLQTFVSLSKLLYSEDGQDIAEYAVMLAVILIIVVATVRLIGSNANTVFSQVASSIT